MKIVICGGHLTPAISVIEELSRDDQVYYFGRKFAIEGDNAVSFEYKTISDLGVRFIEIKTGRYQRKFTKYTISSLLKMPRGFISAFKELLKIKPDVVVGFGGYVSVPVCFSAKLLNIPIVIHEQTLEAGFANKVLSKVAQKICISFDSSEKFFPSSKIILTGNPIRSDLFNPTQKYSNLIKPVIYITGGSVGSHAINLVVMNSLSKLLQKYTIIHQTGASEEFRDFDKLNALKKQLNKELGDRYILAKFINVEEVGEILKISDLVVGRSGINTVTELITFKKPSILIPLPVSQKNEQYKNALFVNKLGLGEIIEQKNLSSQSLINSVNLMMEKISSYKLKNEFNLLQRDSARKIVEVIYATAKNNN